MKHWLISLLWFVCSAAAAHTGTLSGIVQDTSGLPIAGAAVDIAINGANAGSTASDDQGAYSMPVTWAGSSPASCDLRAAAANYVEHAITVSLADGGGAQGFFSLAPADVVFADDFEN